MRGLITVPLSLRLPSHLIAGEPLVSLAFDIRHGSANHTPTAQTDQKAT
ncbi:hypothetical protein [Brucella intermedia]|nr:hypothetical protein [Brucella intermedia]WGG61835.1 hypothetical protein QA414_15045 [Brucella intermedia]